MSLSARLLTLACLGALIGLAAAADPAPAAKQPAGWKAVLIAGDDEEAAFDDAVDAMADKLAGFGVARSDMTILKASDEGVTSANRENIEAAFAHLNPRPGDGCFVFVTSHGSPQEGLMMRRAGLYLDPATLGDMLNQSCGARPTVVIASGCYSGIFATEPPMPAPNRTILTAAREDRTSFGCNAHLQYTFFDKCILENLERDQSWSAIMDKTRACVSGAEFDMRVNAPSEPQISIGAAAAYLRAFGR
jgi:hypothetical protein